MGWLRIDDGFENHEKVEQLSDAAHRLWFRAACWARQRRNAVTNGFVPARVVTELCGGSRGKARALAAELVNARGEPCFGHEFGLWETADGGWQFHDWHDYQPKEDERRQDVRRVKAAAGRAGGKRSAEARRASFGTAQPKRPEARASKQPEADVEAEPEAYASKQTKQPRSPLPPPDPNRSATADLSRSRSSGGSSESRSEADDARPGAASADAPGPDCGRATRHNARPPGPRPLSLEQALALPVNDRAKWLIHDPMLWSYTEPHQWPELREVAETLARAAGQRPPRLAAQRDRGVETLVGHYASDFPQDELLRAAAIVGACDWWQEGRKGLSSFTAEVIRRGLADDPHYEAETNPAVRRALEVANRSMGT